MVCITDIMRQSILTRSEPIDGRNLMLDVSFSDVAMEQVEDMLTVILDRFLMPLSSKCVCDLECEGRRANVNKIYSIYFTQLKRNLFPGISADIFFKDGPVKKVSDLREFYYPRHGSKPAPYSHISADYVPTLIETFGEKLNKPCDASSFLKLISIEKTTFLATPIWSEVGMVLYTGGSIFSASRYSLHLRLQAAVSAFDLQKLILFFTELATELALIHDTCKGAVTLNCGSGQYVFAHASMFPRLPTSKFLWLNGREIHPLRWYNTRYLLGAEWFNILPRSFNDTLRLQIEGIKDDPRFCVTYLPNGNTIIRFTKDLMEMNLQDMYDIRSVLAPALRPGIGFSENAWDFRQRWQMLPVKEEDFHVFPNGSVALKYNLKEAPYVDEMFRCPSWNERF